MSEPQWVEKLDLIPADARGRIRRYIEEGHGASMSTFYRCLLSNDLIGAIQGGDQENRAALPDYVDYLTAYAPQECYGSPEKVAAWRGIVVPPGEDRGATTFVRLMADYCSEGVWNAAGAGIDRDSLPISQDLDDAIGRWCADYESSQFYRGRSDRTVDFDTESFNARGRSLAERLRSELPGWTVVHDPQNA